MQTSHMKTYAILGALIFGAYYFSANFGIFCSTPGIAVSRNMHAKKAAHMLFTGLPISARDASEYGLVSSVVPAEQLDAEVDKICSAIKHKSRSVIQIGKKFFYEQQTMNIEDAYKFGGQVNCILIIYR